MELNQLRIQHTKERGYHCARYNTGGRCTLPQTHKLNGGKALPGWKNMVLRHKTSVKLETTCHHWPIKTLAPGANTDTTMWIFARLVSKQMLTTTLDIMVKHIGAWVKTDKAHSKDFKVVSFMFMNDIQKAKSVDDYQKKSPGFLHKHFEQRLKGSSKFSYFQYTCPVGHTLTASR
jgi:hypothetical protein